MPSVTTHERYARQTRPIQGDRSAGRVPPCWASSRDDHGLDPIAEGQRAAVIRWTDDTASAYDELVASGAPALGGWLGMTDRQPWRK